MSFRDLLPGKIEQAMTGTRSGPWVAGESRTSFLGLRRWRTQRGKTGIHSDP